MYKAVVIGASGNIGKALVSELAKSEKCASITVFVRRPIEEFKEYGDKLQQHVIDFEKTYEEVKTKLDGEHKVAFNTLGLGAPSKHPAEEFQKVDVEYATNFAKACKEGGVEHMSMLTAVNADPKGWDTYSKTKGKVEENFKALSFARLSIFRPSLILENTHTPGILATIFPKISWMLPARLHEISSSQIARSMRVNAEKAASPTQPEILTYTEMFALCSE
eukprot:Colp12_sorted_trinity150504_noHs@15980